MDAFAQKDCGSSGFAVLPPLAVKQHERLVRSILGVNATIISDQWFGAKQMFSADQRTALCCLMSSSLGNCETYYSDT